MKQFITIVLFTLIISGVHAQIGIGTTTPDASAALEVSCFGQRIFDAQNDYGSKRRYCKSGRSPEGL